MIRRVLPYLRLQLRARGQALLRTVSSWLKLLMQVSLRLGTKEPVASGAQRDGLRRPPTRPLRCRRHKGSDSSCRV